MGTGMAVGSRSAVRSVMMGRTERMRFRVRALPAAFVAERMGAPAAEREDTRERQGRPYCQAEELHYAPPVTALAALAYS